MPPWAGWDVIPRSRAAKDEFCSMDYVNDILKHFESGAIDRRRLLQMLALTSSTAAFGAASSAGQSPGANRSFPVTTVNHLSIGLPDYMTERNFYIEFFGMRDAWDDGKKCQLDCGNPSAPNSIYLVQGAPGSKPVVGHFAFGVPDFWSKRMAIKEDLDRRALKGIRADGEPGWSVNGPSGYQVQFVPEKDPGMFPGAAQPCQVAKSETCRAAYAVGLKGLDQFPKPSSKGFKATHFKYFVLHVPDLTKERDFYTRLLGMKVAENKADECSLRFGKNTLVLRPAGGDGKPHCNEFAFAVENYDSAKAKAELERRGMNPKPGTSKGAWSFTDPAGFSVEIAQG